MQVEDYLKLYQLPQPSGPADLLKAGAVEADLILDKGQALSRMAEIISEALQRSNGSAATAEKEAKGASRWQDARSSPFGPGVPPRLSGSRPGYVRCLRAPTKKSRKSSRRKRSASLSKRSPSPIRGRGTTAGATKRKGAACDAAA